MKYNEFESLTIKLESNGIDLNEFVRNVTGENLFEAADDGQVDITGGNIITRSGRARMKLNNNAKKVQEEMMTNLYQKNYANILKGEIDIIKQIQKLKDDDKTIDEIKTALATNINSAKTAQTNQLRVLDKAADKMLDNYTKKVDGIIRKSKMTDNNKLRLSNYWAMLTAQMKLNLYKYIQRQELKFVKNTLGDEADDTTINDIESILSNKSVDDLIKTNETAVEEKKTEVKQDLANEKAEGDGGDAEKTDEEKPEGESENIKDEEPKEEKPEITAGKYTIINPADKKKHEVTVQSVDEMGVHFIIDDSTSKKVHTMNPDDFNEILKKEGTKDDEAVPVEAEEVNNDEEDKNPKIEVGKTYEFTDAKGDEHKLIITKLTDDEVNYKKDDDPKTYKVSKALLDKKPLKALGVAKPPVKKPIKMGGQPTSTGKAIPMSQGK